jgi:hypothetical protein
MKIVRKSAAFTDNRAVLVALVREIGIFTDNLSV